MQVVEKREMVWKEINGNLWLKLKLAPQPYRKYEDPYRCIFVNMSFVQEINPYTRTIYLNGGMGYEVTQETMDSIVEGLL
jgi:hypothetical protein